MVRSAPEVLFPLETHQTESKERIAGPPLNPLTKKGHPIVS